MIRLAVAPLVALLASCGNNSPSTVLITNAWAQPLDASGRSIAAYMTILLRCSQTDTLQSAAVRAPLKASLHQSRVVENKLEMTALTSVMIHCGKPFMLKPLAKHAMVTGLYQPVTIGTSVPLTLTFEHAGKVDVSVPVTTMAILENVDPMNMHGGSQSSDMSGMHMH